MRIAIGRRHKARRWYARPALRVLIDHALRGTLCYFAVLGDPVEIFVEDGQANQTRMLVDGSGPADAALVDQSNITLGPIVNEPN